MSAASGTRLGWTAVGFGILLVPLGVPWIPTVINHKNWPAVTHNAERVTAVGNITATASRYLASPPLDLSPLGAVGMDSLTAQFLGNRLETCLVLARASP